MLRIRFHGRGGQGMKTASRIVSTAAFREGQYAQDSPIYGAERRGAPVAAFTRIADAPILERGVIPSADLVVIADETLLDDLQAQPLQGLSPTATGLVNSARSTAAFREHYAIAGPLGVVDATALALTYTGSIAALSVALGAAACRLAGLSQDSMEQAVREELEALGLDVSRIEQNLGLARVGYAQLVAQPSAHLAALRTAAAVPRPRVVTPTYQGPWRGTPSVAVPPNTPLRRTGNWRVWRPVIDLTHCTRCWICFVSCPDGAITLDSADTPSIDYAVCKGCLMCVEECPTHTIHQVREADA
ncbi:MAG: 2-oxoacid:acceptor oxidoreductase family protein [Nitrospinae bacterium]|nr:2-oxoacid:acceptor oxidoreductase family protein [Nitrospinota bacterium]